MGLRLGKGESLADITSSMNGAVAEGVLTSRSAHALAQKLKVECPIMVSGVNCVNVTCLKLFGYNPAS